MIESLQELLTEDAFWMLVCIAVFSMVMLRIVDRQEREEEAERARAE